MLFDQEYVLAVPLPVKVNGSFGHKMWLGPASTKGSWYNCIFFTGDLVLQPWASNKETEKFPLLEVEIEFVVDPFDQLMLVGTMEEE